MAAGWRIGEETAQQLVLALLTGADSLAEVVSGDENLASWLDELAGVEPGSDCFLRALTSCGETSGPWCRSLAALARQRLRLEELETSFAEALQQEKLESLRELAYGASHEINNPLANISTRAQTLLRDETDPERRRKLATINAQAFRAHEMIADMMLFAKPPSLALELVDLAELIDAVVGELQVTAAEQGTKIVVCGSDEPCCLQADPHHLCVAVKALCRNSLEAISAGGRITITLAYADEAVISVADTGPGISAEARKHLFDPFYSGREAGRGLGFGLSKCWRIVQLHGGSIEVETQEGRGASFTIRLPAQTVCEPTATTLVGRE